MNTVVKKVTAPLANTIKAAANKTEKKRETFQTVLDVGKSVQSPVVNAWANYAQGEYDTLAGQINGFIEFSDNPAQTIENSVNYFLSDPLRNNPVTALGMYYYEVGKASNVHDWNTVSYKLGVGAVTVAEVLGTEYVLKGINGLKKNPAAKNPAGKSSVANGVKESATSTSSGIRNHSRYSLTGAEHYEDLKHVFGADNVKWETNSKKTFIEIMDADEAQRYKAYWSQGAGHLEKVKVNGEDVYQVMSKGKINTRQRLYTVPGVRSIKDVKICSKTGKTYIRETIFDEYGRRIGNNDFTDHGRPFDHADPHYHMNSYLNPSEHGKGVPGLHPNTPITR